ncbi:hypothetical protein [Streptomyces sp. NPDC001292]|uniref:hypothetical protein n=1 Tax=Streptomyces sp. NPDC001292 TaxID=3364558 RepID=UPI003699B326
MLVVCLLGLVGTRRFRLLGERLPDGQPAVTVGLAPRCSATDSGWPPANPGA